MESAIQTHIGCVRQTNEDSGAIRKYENGWVLAIVADGMGGHQAGDVASQMAVDIIAEQIENITADITPSGMQGKLDEAIRFANRQILDYAQIHEECRGMGTTIVIALINEQYGILAHIGDSRIYKYSEQKLQQITSDHTLVNELLRSQQITPTEAANHPRKNILTRALGTEPNVKADYSVLHWDRNDILLLCSDGLSGKISDEKIANILQDGSLEQMVNKLISCSLKAGGEDNITVILLRNASGYTG